MEATRLGRVAEAVTLVLGGWRHSSIVTALWVGFICSVQYKAWSLVILLILRNEKHR